MEAIERLDTLAGVLMRHRGEFDLSEWGAKTSCGTVACVAGWVGLSDEFPDAQACWILGVDGNYVLEPIGDDWVELVSQALLIPHRMAEWLTDPNDAEWKMGDLGVALGRIAAIRAEILGGYWV